MDAPLRPSADAAPPSLPPLPSPPLPSSPLPSSLPPAPLLPSADAICSLCRRAAPTFARTLEIYFYFYFILFFLWVVFASWKRENFFSVFGFQSPSSTGFAGEASRRRRFFWPSSPSHPSKLYSTLGWLNSKVPKPFPPFTLRLIDVDGF
jgi:hypothetical protein